MKRRMAWFSANVLMAALLLASCGPYPGLANVRGFTPGNGSGINDPPGTDAVIEAAFQEIQKNIIVNFPKTDQLYRELVPYLLDKAFVIPRPTPYSYRLWSPWVKNYHGEPIGMALSLVWVDRELKEQMTGRR